MGASFSKSFSRLKGPKGTKTGVTGWGLGWASHVNRSRNPAGPPDLVPDLDRAETETSTTPDPESSERDDSITKKSA